MMYSLFEIFEINGNFLTVVPDSPGFPQDTSLPLISLASTFLVFEISSRYLFQSANDNLGEFLKKKKSLSKDKVLVDFLLNMFLL